MKYLVTGGAGFIGSHLIDSLIANEHIVICIDDLSTGFQKNLRETDSIRFIGKKIQDVSINEIDNDISGIFHLAAQASVPVSVNDLYRSSSNNLLGTLKVWEMAQKFDLPLVYASSSAVYGNLALGDDSVNTFDIMSPYAQDKKTMEDYAKMCFDLYNIPSLGLRFFNVYGPRQDASNSYSGVISIFIDRLLNDQRIEVNGGYQTRDFIFVDDIINVLIESMIKVSNEKIVDVINVGTGRSTSINDLLNTISLLMDKEPDLRYNDLPHGDPERSLGEYGKLDSMLNAKRDSFTELSSGLLKTIDYCKNSAGIK